MVYTLQVERKQIILSGIVFLALALLYVQYSFRNTAVSDTPINLSIMESTSTTTYKWPARENVIKITVSKYSQAIDRSNSNLQEDKSVKRYELANKEEIDAFFNLLNQIPTEGDMFMDFTGEVDLTTANIFYENGKKDIVEVYGGRVKTPATSFLTGENSGRTEKQFLDFIAKGF
jgi:hypothetical protein